MFVRLNDKCAQHSVLRNSSTVSKAWFGSAWITQKGVALHNQETPDEKRIFFSDMNGAASMETQLPDRGRA
jgi:hypothetical protein